MNEEKKESKHPGGIYLSDLAQQYFPNNTPEVQSANCTAGLP